ncbi:Asp/Glu racemase [Rhodobacteraceae bacterium F11138]|nr:Asp/Glu racemase [Rhodobacteraceae bacterium F11138]
MGLIRVINPNSTQAITDKMAQSLAPYAARSGYRIDCVTLSKGPAGVASDEDIAQVAPLVAEAVGNDAEADVFVIACYSDPGLSEARQVTDKPVIGIGEAAVSTALALGDRFGIISVSDWSVARHAQYMMSRDIHARCAGDRPLGFSVADTQNADAFEMIEKVARQLTEQDKADVLITACAGMSRHQPRLEAATGAIVIDPVRAAVAVAISVLIAREAAAHD